MSGLLLFFRSLRKVNRLMEAETKRFRYYSRRDRASSLRSVGAVRAVKSIPDSQFIRSRRGAMRRDAARNRCERTVAEEVKRFNRNVPLDRGMLHTHPVFRKHVAEVWGRRRDLESQLPSNDRSFLPPAFFVPDRSSFPLLKPLLANARPVRYARPDLEHQRLRSVLCNSVSR